MRTVVVFISKKEAMKKLAKWEGHTPVIIHDGVFTGKVFANYTFWYENDELVGIDISQANYIVECSVEY